MRKSTIAFITLLIAYSMTFLGRAYFEGGGYGSAVKIGTGVVGALVVGAILSLVNPHLLAWRKARGRDVEEEERYETDHGFISLTPKDSDPRNR